MAETVYLLCALTSALCAGLLLRGYRRTQTRLLFWSSLSFLGFALSNAILFVDLVIVPDVDLSLSRQVLALVSTALLLFGLLWEERAS